MNLTLTILNLINAIITVIKEIRFKPLFSVFINIYDICFFFYLASLTTKATPLSFNQHCTIWYHSI